jgi:hypothetical protein
MMNDIKVDTEYTVDVIEKFLDAQGVDTTPLDGDDDIEFGLSITFRFDDKSIAAVIVLTGYTAIMAIYKVAYLAPVLRTK